MPVTRREYAARSKMPSAEKAKVRSGKACPRQQPTWSPPVPLSPSAVLSVRSSHRIGQAAVAPRLCPIGVATIQPTTLPRRRTIWAVTLVDLGTACLDDGERRDSFTSISPRPDKRQSRASNQRPDAARALALHANAGLATVKYSSPDTPNAESQGLYATSHRASTGPSGWQAPQPVSHSGGTCGLAPAVRPNELLPGQPTLAEASEKRAAHFHGDRYPKAPAAHAGYRSGNSKQAADERDNQLPVHRSECPDALGFTYYSSLDGKPANRSDCGQSFPSGSHPPHIPSRPTHRPHRRSECRINRRGSDA